MGPTLAQPIKPSQSPSRSSIVPFLGKKSRVSQDDVFWSSEADRWYQRNRSGLADPSKALRDPPLQLIDRFLGRSRLSGIGGVRGLEIGCSDGWRLRALAERYGSGPKSPNWVGVDPSSEAIQAGRRLVRAAGSDSAVTLRRARADDLPFADQEFDLAILYFVFHWISRQSLLRSVAEIDRVVKPGGHLIVGDFLPRRPKAVPYHHLPGKDVFTFKQDYPAIFVASGNYEIVARRIYHLGSKAAGTRRTDDNRAVCALLRKTDV